MTAGEYRKLREQLGAQPDAAEILGVVRFTLYRRESGRQVISKEAEYALRYAVEHYVGIKPIRRLRKRQ